MGVLRRTCGCALLVLLVVGSGSGCQDDPDDDDQGGGIAGNPAQLEPTNKSPTDPTSPGLEPPNHGTPDSSGGSGGAASPGLPTGSATAGAPAMMAAGGGAVPVANAGSGAMEMPGTAADAGMPADASAGDHCVGAPDCGIDKPCEDPALHCIVLDSCMRAVCIKSEAACEAECGTSECALLESYPEQIACN